MVVAGAGSGRGVMLDGMVRAHAALAALLDGLDDAAMRRPSLLANWSVGHVLTHIARNADGFRAVVEGAAVGEVRPMYPGGPTQRNGDIEAGAGRSAEAIADDVRSASAGLEAALAALDETGWAGEGSAPFGALPVDDVPHRRWREVEVHLSDLGVGPTWRDWSPAFVRSELRVMGMLWNSRLPMGMTGLPAAAFAVDDHHRLAWLLGRATIDGLEPSGLMS